jgi:hypothetical protein
MQLVRASCMVAEDAGGISVSANTIDDTDNDFLRISR